VDNRRVQQEAAFDSGSHDDIKLENADLHGGWPALVVRPAYSS
jgi:hypothetical protein